MSQKSFNLIDSPWMPCPGIGAASLSDVFRRKNVLALGGSPIQKIVMMKFLLAIAQSACPMADDEEWLDTSVDQIADRCMEYLESRRSLFDLYGDRPFLQVPEIAKGGKVSYGTSAPEVAHAGGSSPVLTRSQIEKPLSDEEKALWLLTTCGAAMGGKQAEHFKVAAGLVRKEDLKKELADARNDDDEIDGNGMEKRKGFPTPLPGRILGGSGYLHSFYQGDTLQDSIKMNLLTTEEIHGLGYEFGLGVAPWDAMPTSPDCVVADRLKGSLMGALLPMSRFCFLVDDQKVHYSDGLKHDHVLIDPSTARIRKGNGSVHILETRPNERAWQSFPALMSFLSAKNQPSNECYQLSKPFARITKRGYPKVGVWSGGLQVSSTMGEQLVNGRSDYSESFATLECNWIDNVLDNPWFDQVEKEVWLLEKLHDTLSRSIKGYYATAGVRPTAKGKNPIADGHAAQAGMVFWTYCGVCSQALYAACVSYKNHGDKEPLCALRVKIGNEVKKIYTKACSNGTGRQIEGWVKNMPNISGYLDDSDESLTGKKSKKEKVHAE